jgi:hypothetical protein
MIRQLLLVTAVLFAANVYATDVNRYQKEVKKMTQYALDNQTASTAYYVGTDSKNTKCYVTISPERSKKEGSFFSVRVRSAGETEDDVEFGEGSETLYSSDEDGRSLSVESVVGTNGGWKATQQSSDSDYDYTSTIQLMRREASDGLAYALISETPKLKEGKQDDTPLKGYTRRCANLTRISILSNSDFKKAREMILKAYFKNLNHPDAKTAGNVYCTVRSSDALNCDINLPTDYADDTLHAKILVGKDKVIKVLGKVDFEGGC